MSSSSPDPRLNRFRESMREHGRERSSRRIADRYRCLEKLGDGASGEVFRALDERIGREVAVKILKSSGSAFDIPLRRFQQEAQIAARLPHPNIVAVYDAGEDEGLLYLVMELVPGTTLARILSGQRPDIPVALELLEKVARAVHHAHENGIVHRDLKPGNILVTPASEPKIVDFGLAFLSGAGTALTRTGVPMGTPTYMAPEQAEGRKERIGPRTDVYALGILLYETVTGRKPFEGDSAVEVLGKVIREEPPRPRGLNPAVTSDLEAVIDKATAKDPRHRYESAGEFAEDLRKLRSGEPTSARPISAAGRLARRLKKNRTVAVLTAMVLTLAAALSWIGMNRRTDDAPASSSPPKALKLLEEARNALDRGVLRQYEKELDPQDVDRILDEGRSKLEEAVAIAPELALGHYLLGWARELEGDEEGAVRGWRRCLELDPEFGPAHYRLGCLLLVQKAVEDLDRAAARESPPAEDRRFVKEAIRHLDAALKIGSGFGDDLQRRFAEGLSFYARGDFDSARRTLDEGIRVLKTARGVEQLLWLRGLITTFEEGKAEDVSDFDRALDVRPCYPLALFYRAWALQRCGRVAEALADLDAVIRARPRFAAAYLKRGVLLGTRGEWTKAIGDFDAAIGLQPGNPKLFFNRGIARLALARPEEAISDFDEMLRIDPDSTDALVQRAAARRSKSEELLRRGAAPEAAEERRSALRDLDAVVQKNPGSARAWNDRGRLLLDLERTEEAIRNFTEATERDPSFVDAFINRGVARCLAKEYLAGIDDFSEALRIKPGDWDAYAKRGLAWNHAGDLASALSDYEEALRLAPPDWPARPQVRQAADALRQKN